LNCKELTCDPFRLWYSAEEISGENDGDALALWEDSSPSGENLTSVAQPIYRTNQVTGHPIVRFDDNEVMSTSTNVFNNRNKFIFCILFRPSSLAASGALFSYGTLVGDWALSAGQSLTSFTVFTPPSLPDVSLNNGSVAGFFTNNTDFVRICVIYNGDYSGADRLRIYRNGVRQVVTITGVIPPRLQLITDTTLYLGSANGIVNFLDGDIAEFIVKTDKVNVNELIQIDQFIESRYNL